MLDRVLHILVTFLKILTFLVFLHSKKVSFLEVDTWVFWLVTFPLFPAFFTCTTTKKLSVRLLMAFVLAVIDGPLIATAIVWTLNWCYCPPISVPMQHLQDKDCTQLEDFKVRTLSIQRFLATQVFIGIGFFYRITSTVNTYHCSTYIDTSISHELCADEQLVSIQQSSPKGDAQTDIPK